MLLLSLCLLFLVSVNGYLTDKYQLDIDKNRDRYIDRFHIDTYSSDDIQISRPPGFIPDDFLAIPVTDVRTHACTEWDRGTKSGIVDTDLAQVCYSSYIIHNNEKIYPTSCYTPFNVFNSGKKPSYAYYENLTLVCPYYYDWYQKCYTSIQLETWYRLDPYPPGYSLEYCFDHRNHTVYGQFFQKGTYADYHHNKGFVNGMFLVDVVNGDSKCGSLNWVSGPRTTCDRNGYVYIQGDTTYSWGGYVDGSNHAHDVHKRSCETNPIKMPGDSHFQPYTRNCKWNNRDDTYYLDWTHYYDMYNNKVRC